MWRPSRAFKGNFVAIGFFLVSLFLIGLFATQCALWVFLPVVLLVIVLEIVGRKKNS